MPACLMPDRPMFICLMLYCVPTQPPLSYDLLHFLYIFNTRHIIYSLILLLLELNIVMCMCPAVTYRVLIHYYVFIYFLLTANIWVISVVTCTWLSMSFYTDHTLFNIVIYNWCKIWQFRYRVFAPWCEWSLKVWHQFCAQNMMTNWKYLLFLPQSHTNYLILWSPVCWERAYYIWIVIIVAM